MEAIKIKSRWNGKVLYSGEHADIKEAVEAAVKAGANLRDADLCGADLRGADLCGADLCDADLRGANLTGANLRDAYLGGGEKLIGERPVFVIGPIGSRCDYLTEYLTDKGIRLRAGCFFGDIDTFRNKLESTHGDNDHAAEYRAALALIEKHVEIWTPKEEAITKATGENT